MRIRSLFRPPDDSINHPIETEKGEPQKVQFSFRLVLRRTKLRFMNWNEDHSTVRHILSKALFFYIYLPHNNYKNIRKEEKKKWWGDRSETIGDYERLGLLELRARAVSHQLTKWWRKVEDGKMYELFSYLLNNLIFSFFLKEERDWELMTSLSSELENLRPWKKGENFVVFVWQYGRQ